MQKSQFRPSGGSGVSSYHFWIGPNLTYNGYVYLIILQLGQLEYPTEPVVKGNFPSREQHFASLPVGDDDVGTSFKEIFTMLY